MIKNSQKVKKNNVLKQRKVHIQKGERRIYFCISAIKLICTLPLTLAVLLSPDSFCRV